jgi:hypothetical protein
MQVKANNVDAARAVTVQTAKARPVAAVEDSTSFNRVAALEAALKATPAVRPEAVARARELLSDVKYPPIEAINGIAMLLALKIDATAEA